MNKELAKTLTTALVQFIDRERPEGTMCCSNTECVNLEKAFNAENFVYVEVFIKMKLSGLTEFEDKLVSFALQCGGQWDTANEEAKKWSNEFLSLAKKELLKDDELGKKHLEGYIKGREEIMREMKDFIESHFNCEKAKKGTPIVYNTQSGTSTLKAEG